MKLYKENRIDQEYEIADSELIQKFKDAYSKSKNYISLREARGIEFVLRFFIGSKDGLNSTVEEIEFMKFFKKNRLLLTTVGLPDNW